MKDYPKFSKPEIVTAEPLTERIYDAALQAEPHNPDYQRIANRTLRFLIDQGVIAFVEDCDHPDYFDRSDTASPKLLGRCKVCLGTGKVVVRD